MAINVYRCEQLIYFCDNPFRQQGYHMSTSSDSTEVVGDQTWEAMEARALKMFPDCDPIRVAGFALIACLGDDDWQGYACEKLEEELNPDGEEGNYDDVLTIVDIAEQIVGDADAGPEQD